MAGADHDDPGSADPSDASLAALRGLTERWPVDHVSVAVLHRGVEQLRWGDPRRVYRLASLSKPMAAWAALVAVEEGIVTLDGPLRHVDAPPGCTLRHLLAHAGGFGFDGPDPIAGPATRRIYSNTGFDRAALEVERAAAMPFADYLALAVFEPLGMTGAELRGSAAHGVWANVDDVGRFVGELLRPRLLAAATAEDAGRPQWPELAGIVPGVGRFAPCPWGLGLEIVGNKSPHWTGRHNSPRTVGHFGGAGTMMWADPVADVGLVALTDRPFDDWSETALVRWPELSDAVLEQVGAGAPG
jgi:CubicO group peptidase (beta-lactamase class C family)